MDLASFLINTLNKIEPTTEASLSVLRISLDQHFKEQITIMENYEKAKEINFQIDQEIEKVPVKSDSYEDTVNRLESSKLVVPKVNILTRIIYFFNKPMARLALYVLFIIVSGWLIKRNLAKKAVENEDDDDDDDRPRISKKHRKILKKYGKYDENLR